MMKDVPKHWEKVLQAAAHWIAYKKQYFDGHLLLEGAIVAELTQLLSAKLDKSMQLKCEMHYKNILGAGKGSKRADLVVGKKESDEFIIHEVIEVKRFEINKKKGNLNEIKKDFEKLSQVTDLNPRPRLFQLIVGQHSLPDVYFNKKKESMKRKNVYQGNKPINAIPRLSRRAVNRSGLGGFCLLIEVNP